MFFLFFSSRRRHTRFSRDWSSDVCSSDLGVAYVARRLAARCRNRRCAAMARDPALQAGRGEAACRAPQEQGGRAALRPKSAAHNDALRSPSDADSQALPVRTAVLDKIARTLLYRRSRAIKRKFLRTLGYRYFYAVEQRPLPELLLRPRLLRALVDAGRRLFAGNHYNLFPLESLQQRYYAIVLASVDPLTR